MEKWMRRIYLIGKFSDLSFDLFTIYYCILIEDNRLFACLWSIE